MDDLGFSQTHDDLLRFVHRCVTTLDHPLAQPAVPAYLNDLLSTEDFVGGMAPRIGRKSLRVIAIDGFPRVSFPGILGALDNLAIEYRWHTRAILLDPEEARGLLDKTRRKWRSKVRGWKDQLLRIETGAVNLFAQEMSADAEEAMGVASSGDVQFCVYNTVIICAHEREDRLDEAAGLVVKTIQNLGFACRTETVNAVEAWRGSLPGDGYRNVRRVILHTLNLADLMPITAVWAGDKNNPSPLMPPNSPPLLYAATTGATPFRFNLHVGDLGHTLMIGPPGAGKSTFLGLAAAQWFRYPRAQVFAFDKGYSLFTLTQAAGGEFYDIGGELTHWPSARSETSTRKGTSRGRSIGSRVCARSRISKCPRGSGMRWARRLLSCRALRRGPLRSYARTSRIRRFAKHSNTTRWAERWGICSMPMKTCSATAGF